MNGMADNNINVNIGSRGTTAGFTLLGGLYQVNLIAATVVTSSVVLQVLGPDGSTWIPVGTINGIAVQLPTSASASSVSLVAWLAAGTYRIGVLGTATGLYAAVSPIRASANA